MFGQSGSRRRGQSTNVRDLLVRGRAAAKAGDFEEAQFYLEWVLRTEANESQEIEAWYWLSEINADPAQKREYLELILARNPVHALARRSLALLDGKLDPAELVNPDQLPQTAADETREATVDRFACPRCAARLVFTPDGGALYCEHCGYDDPAASGGSVDEQDFVVALATARGHQQPVSLQTVTCSGCVATLLLAPEAISLTCPYCDSTYAVQVRETKELIPPQGIIPFQIGAASAQREMEGWLERQGVRTRAFMHGFYLPAWTFDIGGTVEWRGWRYENDQIRFGPGQPGRNTLRVPASGQRAVDFDDLLVPASERLPAALLRSAARYDLRDVRPYAEHYLADWPAAIHEMSLARASLQARKLAVAQVRAQMDRYVPSDVTGASISSAGIAVLSYKLILLPLWIAHYRVGQENKTLLINGQNGKLYAERPPQEGLLDRLKRLF